MKRQTALACDASIIELCTYLWKTKKSHILEEEFHFEQAATAAGPFYAFTKWIFVQDEKKM